MNFNERNLGRLNPTELQTLLEIQRRQRRRFPSVFGLPAQQEVRAFDPAQDRSWNPMDPRFRQTLSSAIEAPFASSPRERIDSGSNDWSHVGENLSSMANLGVDFAPFLGTNAAIGDSRAAFGRGDTIGGYLSGGAAALSTALPGVAALSKPAKRGYDFIRKQGTDYDVENLLPHQKTALSKLGNSLDVPAVRRREQLRFGGLDELDREQFGVGGLGMGRSGTRIDQTPIERNIVTPSDLQGRIGVPVVGDRSQAGGILTQVGGVPLNREVMLQGGPLFPFGRRGTGDGWASMRGAATDKQANLIKAADMGDPNPVGVYSAMGPSSINFSTPPAEAMIAQLDQIGIPKRDLVEFNRAIRNRKVIKKDPETGKVLKDSSGNPIETQPFKDFVGVDDPGVYDQIMGRGTFSREGSGELRKAIVEEMSADSWQQKGFPVYRDTMDAVNQPELARLGRGDAGYAMFESSPNELLRPELEHLSYDTTIPGNAFGGFEAPVPARMMFPETFRRLDRSTNRWGNPMTESDKLGSLMMKKHYEPFGQKWVDDVSRYLESARPY